MVGIPKAANEAGTDLPMAYGDAQDMLTMVARRKSSRGYTASFNSLAARKAIFLLALISIAAPVPGFLPIRAGRF